MTAGVLPFQTLRGMIQNGQISADAPIPDSQIQPASLDLRLGRRAWRIKASFLPGTSGIDAGLQRYSTHELDLRAGAVLEKGCVYLVELQESLNLPNGISAVANAKSSTGRLDLLTRLITRNATEFDRIDSGYHGPIYAEISPRSFSVLVRPDLCLNQIRFRAGQVVLDDAELRALNQTQKLVDTEALIDNGLGFSVDLSAGVSGIVGYRAKSNSGLIDLSRLNHYEVADFWDPVINYDRQIILDPGAFYILVSREAVHIPPDCAAEMAPYLAMVGEFRVHYAGFFDPGFGNETAGGKGSRGVLEVRCHEAPFALGHGQIVGRLVYERMQEVPEVLYGTGLGSNYQGQGMKLSKHFKPPQP